MCTKRQQLQWISKCPRKKLKVLEGIEEAQMFFIAKMIRKKLMLFFFMKNLPIKRGENLNVFMTNAVVLIYLNAYFFNDCL